MIPADERSAGIFVMELKIWRGPKFTAQSVHCKISCLEKWHNIPSGKVLTDAEQKYVTDVLMEWTTREYQKQNLCMLYIRS
jgi:hypothetical protein